MTTEKVNDLEIVTLSDYLTPEKFRIIPAEAVFNPGGISEVPVTFNIHLDSSMKLINNFDNLQILYGFGIMNDKLKALNKNEFYSKKTGNLLSIELNDCGELWILRFELSTEKDKLYAVKANEVIKLINECRHPSFHLSND